MKKIRILRIITRLNVGGPAKQALWLTSLLNDGKEYETTLLCGDVGEGEDDLTRHTAAKIEIRNLPPLSRNISLIRDMKSIIGVYKILKEESPDILHTHTSKAGFVGRVAALLYNRARGGRKRVKVVHTFHGHTFHSYFSWPKERLFLAIERFLARHATDMIIAISEKQYEELTGRYRVGVPGQYEIIPLGIDMTPFREAAGLKGKFRSEFGVEKNCPVIAAIGRVAPVKNYGMYIDAAKILLDSGVNARFFIVGGGQGADELKKRVAEAGIADSFTFTGTRSDIPMILADVDILALTSLNEGTPVSIIEAFASKKAVCATDVGGVRDLVGTGDLAEKRGVLVRSGDTRAFADELRKLILDEKQRAELGNNAYEFVTENFCLERLTKDIKTLYNLITESA